jgi:hypothetical protein
VGRQARIPYPPGICGQDRFAVALWQALARSERKSAADSNRSNYSTRARYETTPIITECDAITSIGTVLPDLGAGVVGGAGAVAAPEAVAAADARACTDCTEHTTPTRSTTRHREQNPRRTQGNTSLHADAPQRELARRWTQRHYHPPPYPQYRCPIRHRACAQNHSASPNRAVYAKGLPGFRVCASCAHRVPN